MKRRKQEADSDDNGFAAWGGYMAAKVAKLDEQFKEASNNAANKLTDIFKGVAIYVNGLTNPSAYELKELMTLHGGIYHCYQISESTTHIIASNLPNFKIKNLGSTPVIKPAWITDSISAGRLLNYKNYLLYTNESKTQPRLHFQSKDSSAKEEFKEEIETCESTIKERSISPDLFSDISLEPIEQKTDIKYNLPNNVLKESVSNRKITKTAVDPGFLSEFYTNSRLHHIATLGASFKQLVTKWRLENKAHFRGKQKLHQLNVVDNAIENNQTVVMHIDMDCFFVSVGLRNRPELKGHPVAVTHAKGSNMVNSRAGVDREAEIRLYNERSANKGISVEKISKLEGVESNSSMSEIASCSYEARKAGVKNGMFLGGALKLCPNLRTIPYDFEGYKDVANTLYETIANYTLDIEAVSCDEMFVDVGPLLRETNVNVQQWAQHIRNEIFTKTRCTCSTGFGSNRLQARLATRKAKPNGCFYLKPDDVEEYMKEVYLKDLPGVGYSTLSKLKCLNLQTCGDVQSFPLHKLQSELGNRNGETLYNQCYGQDKRPLCFEHERKSVSAEVNYGIRFTNMEETQTFLKSLSSELENRLLEIEMQARSVTVKLMVRAKEAPVETAKFLGHGVCDSLSRSSSVLAPITKAEAIYKEAQILFAKLSIDPIELRGVGIQLTRLEKFKQINNALNKFLTKAESKLRNDEVIKVNASTDTDDIDSRQTILNAEKVNVCKKVPEKVKSSTRGRPRKGSNAKINIKHNEKAMLTNFFKTVGSPSPREIQSKICFMQQNIDLTVLANLPDNIRNEIIRDYKLNEKPLEDNGASINKSQIKKTSESIIVSQTNTEIGTIEEKSGNLFSNITSVELKQMLKGWIEKETAPKPFDINMLGEHFKRLALDRQIEELFKLVNFLYRHINKSNNCEWHKAYRTVTDYMQKGMIGQYDNILFMRQRLSCSLH